MSDYYDNPELWHSKGVDYDLSTCLIYNPQEGFALENIDHVLAVVEGENEGNDWRWVILLNDGRYVFLRGGCDYTGWDCQSSAWSSLEDTPEKAAEHEILDGQNSDPSAYQSLLLQIREGKNKTWREGKDEEFGLVGDSNDGD